jgi:hypothetical protein
MNKRMRRRKRTHRNGDEDYFRGGSDSDGGYSEEGRYSDDEGLLSSGIEDEDYDGSGVLYEDKVGKAQTAAGYNQRMAQTQGFGGFKSKKEEPDSTSKKRKVFDLNLGQIDQSKNH